MCVSCAHTTSPCESILLLFTLFFCFTTAVFAFYDHTRAFSNLWGRARARPHTLNFVRQNNTAGGVCVCVALQLATGLVVLTGAPSFLQWRNELMSTNAIPFAVSAAFLLVLLLLHPCLEMERVSSSSSGAVVPPVLNYRHQQRYKAPVERSYKRIYATTSPCYPTPYAPVVAASATPYYVTPSMMPYAAVPYPPPDYDARRVYAV